MALAFGIGHFGITTQVDILPSSGEDKTISDDGLPAFGTGSMEEPPWWCRCDVGDSTWKIFIVTIQGTNEFSLGGYLKSSFLLTWR